MTPEERNEVIKECMDAIKKINPCEETYTMRVLKKLLTPEKPKIKSFEQCYNESKPEGHKYLDVYLSQHRTLLNNAAQRYADQFKTELPSESEFMTKYLEIIEHDTEYEQDAQDLYKWLVNYGKG
jgi:hypothetical protein